MCRLSRMKGIGGEYEEQSKPTRVSQSTAGNQK